jgi:hypothetical protein
MMPLKLEKQPQVCTESDVASIQALFWLWLQGLRAKHEKLKMVNVPGAEIRTEYHRNMSLSVNATPTDNGSFISPITQVKCVTCTEPHEK